MGPRPPWLSPTHLTPHLCQSAIGVFRRFKLYFPLHKTARGTTFGWFIFVRLTLIRPESRKVQHDDTAVPHRACGWLRSCVPPFAQMGPRPPWLSPFHLTPHLCFSNRGFSGGSSCIFRFIKQLGAPPSGGSCDDCDNALGLCPVSRLHVFRTGSLPCSEKHGHF